MKTRSSKSKGRRLQVQLAESLSTRFGLTIEAVPPTRVGVRENGAGYIGEGCGADLRVRRMGEAGLDVALLTAHARTVLAIDEKPCMFECKNTEEVRIGGANFWCERGADAVVRAAFKQLVDGGANPARQTLVVIVSRNRFPPLAIWYARVAPTRAHYDSGIETAYGRCFTMLFLDWLEELDGAVVPVTRAKVG